MAASACGPAGPVEATYIGRTGDIFIAVVAADDLVTAFACDGNYDYLSVAAWFHGPLEDGAATLTNDDGATLDLTIDGDRFNADLHGEGVWAGPHAFTGSAVVDDEAGLYWGRVDGWVGGWIIDAAGEQAGAALKPKNEEVSDVTLEYITPEQTEVVLVDDTVMPIARMTTPVKVE